MTDGESGLAGRGDADRRHQLLRRAFLDQEAAGAGLQSGELLLFAVPRLTSAAPWVYLNTAQKGPRTSSAPAALCLRQLTGRPWAHFAVAATVWVLLPLMLGAARVSRSEIISG